MIATASESSGDVFSGVTPAYVYKIDAAGTVTRFTNNLLPGIRVAIAQYGRPTIDGQGNIYVPGIYDSTILQIDTSGNFTSVAGNGDAGYVDGPSASAEFNNPNAVALDAQGNIYVADTYNYRIRKIDAAGNVTTVAGNGTSGYVDGTGGANGTAEFVQPTALAVDPAGNIWVADFTGMWNYTTAPPTYDNGSGIRRIDPNGNVTTLDIAPDCSVNYPSSLLEGAWNPMDEAPLTCGASGIAIGANGDLYVSSYCDDRVCIIHRQ